MAKVKQFEKILEVLRDASPKAVSKELLAKTLGGDVAMYRISTYIWEVKNKAGVPVEAVKDGRKVVAFRVADTSAVSAPVAVEASEATDEQVADAATA